MSIKFTERQSHILTELNADGLATDAEMAQLLDVSPTTITAELTAIRAMLGVRGGTKPRAKLPRFAAAVGWLRPIEPLSAKEAKQQISKYVETTESFLREIRIGAEYINHCSASLVSLPRLLDEMGASEALASAWYDKMIQAHHTLRAAVDASEVTLQKKARRVGV